MNINNKVLNCAQCALLFLFICSHLCRFTNINIVIVSWFQQILPQHTQTQSTMLSHATITPTAVSYQQI